MALTILLRAMGIAHPKIKYSNLDGSGPSAWKSMPHDWEISMVLPARMHEAPEIYRLFTQPPRGTGKYFVYSEMVPAEDRNVRVSLKMASTMKENLDSRQEEHCEVIPAGVPEEKATAVASKLTSEVA